MSCDFLVLFACLFACFWPHWVACEILVPWPGIKTVPPTMEVWSPKHWKNFSILIQHLILLTFTFGSSLYVLSLCWNSSSLLICGPSFPYKSLKIFIVVKLKFLYYCPNIWVISGLSSIDSFPSWPYITFPCFIVLTLKKNYM